MSSSALDPPSPMDNAIERLNTSITQLCKVNEVIHTLFDLTEGAIKRNRDGTSNSMPSTNFDVSNLDFEIIKITELTDQLCLSNIAKESDKSRRGILPATAKFVKTACRIIAPAAKNVLVAAADGFKSVPILSPFSILFTTVSKLIKLLEDDSDRKAAFENELGGIQIALQRVTVHAHVPKRFPQVKEDLQVRALDVLSAVLDLIGRQLSHLKKFRAIRLASTLLTDTDKWYKDAGDRLRKCLDNFITSIQIGDFVIVSDTNEIVRQLSDDERKEHVIEWISKEDTHSTHESKRELRTPNTGNWFLKSPEFEDWVEGTAARTLICHGIPGAGKSFLTSRVIDHLIDLKVKPAYIYFNRDDERTYLDITASLLKQLLSALPDVPSQIKDEFSKFKAGEKTRESTTFIGFIKLISIQFSRVAILLDGFDECPRDNQSKLIKFVTELQQSGIRVYLTTRPDCQSLLAAKVDGAVFKEILARDEDIERFLRAKMKSEMRDDLDPDSEAQVIRDIVPKAKGMFLLAAFQIKSLLRDPSIIDLEMALAQLPKSAEDAYESIIQLIKTNTNTTLQCVLLPVLSWVYYAKRPLTLDEMWELLIFRRPNFADLKRNEKWNASEGIVRSCGSLIIHEKSSGVLRFCHATVREWLPESTISKDLLLPVEITKTCLNYLDLEEFDKPCIDWESVQRRKKMYKLSDYASKYWHQHVREVEHDASVQDQVFKTFKSQNKRVSILQLADYMLISNDPTHLRLSLLHIICRHGLTVISTAFHDRGFDIDDLHPVLERIGPYVDGRIELGESTALHLAAGHGKLETVQWLVGHGADVKAADYWGRTVLHEAVRTSKLEMVQWLVEHGADVKAAGNRRWTILHEAVRRGKLEMVQWLVEHGADVKAADNWGWTILHGAVRRGKLEMVQWLVEHGADVKAATKAGKTVLHEAVRERNLKMVQWLVEHGADITAADPRGRTVLHVAKSSPYNDKMVRWLVANGADITATDSD